jgi:3-dehydrosphinganine reductase
MGGKRSTDVVLATKAALRSLADTLRMEVLRLSNAHSEYSVHCAFPSNFISPAFIQEQKNKPLLTKQIEGTDGPAEEVEKKFPSADRMAEVLMKGVEKGEYVVCDESVESGLFWAGMAGTSKKRGLGVWDNVLGVAMMVIWPYYRWKFDGMCRRDGKREGR